MGLIRTFVAVRLTDDVKKCVGALAGELRALEPDVKWVETGLLHITLKFLGDIEEDATGDVLNAIETVARDMPAFDVVFSGLGAFPNTRRPRVVWAGVEKGADELVDLAGKVDDELVKIGFCKEEKTFRPHITLGRAKRGKTPQKLEAGIKKVSAEDLGTQTVDRVELVKSELRPTGPVYTPLGSLELAGSKEG